MKYLFDLMTKLIIFLLVLSLCVSLFACSKDEDDGSEADDSAVESLYESTAFTVEKAVELLKRDRAVTEIFVGNSLCDSSMKTVKRSLVPEGEEYADFSEIESLMANTYLSDSGDREFFLSYPENLEPSVKSVDGRTSVFRHAGSKYNDYADYTTVSVADTEDETVKEITYTTRAGNKLKVNARRSQEGKWLLEKGIYRLNASEAPEIETVFNKINQGSFKSLSGKILVVSLFVSDNKSKFDDESEAAFNKKVVAAAERASQNAEQWGAHVQFDFASRSFSHKGELGERPIDFDIMLAKTSFGSLQTFAQATLDLSGYDGYFFVVCLNKEVETSFEACDGTEDTQIHYGERAIIGSSATALDVYKSIYCLLGADLRNDETADMYTESLYDYYFPNDVAVTSDLETAEISPVTALMCGVTDELNSLYHIFVPKNK